MLLQDLKNPAHQPQLRAEARLSQALREADAVVIGAGAGLSASAGFTYAGARFSRYFGDFEAAYGFIPTAHRRSDGPTGADISG